MEPTQPSQDAEDPKGPRDPEPAGTAASKKAASVVAALSAAAESSSGSSPGAAKESQSPAAATSLAAFAASDTGEDASRVLRDAARRAPLPSLSGLCFEIMGLAWVLGALAGLSLLSLLFDSLSFSLVSQAMGPLFTVPSLFENPPSLVLGLPIILLSIRVGAGLAAIASDGVGQGGGANAWRAWKLGSKDAVAAVGIALQIFGMMAAATLTLLTPLILFAATVGKDTLGLFGVVLSGLALAFMLVYGAALGALQQLSMASLVRHHRGVGSAILHGWRLMRARPLSSQRMAAAEFASRVTIVGLAAIVGRTFGWAWGISLLVLAGALVGGLRCHAWSMAYPHIGGLK